MHCPSCGQQQVSNETKFCSRCGMPLSLVAEVTAHGGFLPQLAELEAQQSKQGLFTRRNGVMASVFFMITFMMLLPALFGVANLSAAAGVSAIIGVFGGMILMIASLVFLPGAIPGVNQGKGRAESDISPRTTGQARNRASAGLLKATPFRRSSRSRFRATRRLNPATGAIPTTFNPRLLRALRDCSMKKSSAGVINSQQLRPLPAHRPHQA